MSAVSTRDRTRALNRGFTPIIVLSLILHATALAGVVYGQHLKGRRPVVMNSVPVQLVKLGKPRDPNLLPRITQPAVAPPPPDEGIALDVADKKTKPREPTKEKEPKISDAAKRLLESRPDDLDRAINRIEEEEGAENGSIYGTTTDATNAASGYYAQVSEILHRNYKLPATIAESERRFLEAEVVLFIQRDGTISKYEFQKEHPNTAFMRALELLLQQTKLPPPPREVADALANAGIAVRFKPSR